MSVQIQEQVRQQVKLSQILKNATEDNVLDTL
jgi:hypothetical protein